MCEEQLTTPILMYETANPYCYVTQQSTKHEERKLILSAVESSGGATTEKAEKKERREKSKKSMRVTTDEEKEVRKERKGRKRVCLNVNFILNICSAYLVITQVSNV